MFRAPRGRTVVQALDLDPAEEVVFRKQAGGYACFSPDAWMSQVQQHGGLKGDGTASHPYISTQVMEHQMQVCSFIL